MTSPSMKSTEKKTPEKKAASAEPEQTAQENAEQQATPLKKLNLNNYAWFRIFRFANLLCKQG